MPRRTDPDAPAFAQPITTPRRVVPLAIRLLVLLTLCLAALPFTAHIARASTYAVTVTSLPDTNNGACAATGVPPCSLREAIQFANGKNDGDTVTITLPAGTYNLGLLGAGEDNNTSGDLDIHRSIILNGAGAATTIIDGHGTDRVLEIFGNATATISGVTIRNGKVANHGGGIYNHGGALTLTDSVVKENGGSHIGGGIYSSGALTLTNTTVSDNTVTGISNYDNGSANGGGIYSSSSLKLTGSKVQTNQAIGVDGGSAYGGGILTTADATLTASVVQDNSATGGPFGPTSGWGGGIHHMNSPLTLTNSSVIANKAIGGAGGGPAYGGGIFGTSGNAALTITGGGVSANVASGTNGSSASGGGIMHDGGALTITDSALNGNAATGGSANGGGLYLSAFGPATLTGTALGGNSATGTEASAEGGAIYSHRSLTIAGSTFNGNSAIGGWIINLAYGGGISQREGNLTIINSTFSGNDATVGAGAIYMAAVNGAATVTNATIADNSSGVVQDNSTLTLANTIVANSKAGGANCGGPITDGGHNLDSGATCAFNAAVGSLSNTSPQLAVFDFYGTTKFKTYALLPGSPAVDKVPAVGASCPGSDQLGAPRPQGNGCDIGAIEFPYQPVVTLSKSGNGSVGGNPGPYPFGSTATFTATPDAGNLFLGWTVDGTFVGFNPTLALPMTRDRAVVAAFAPIPAFCDVAPDAPGYEAIINLAARGIVKGQDGCFNPNEPLLRAQSAAMLARAFGWDGEDHGNSFPDQGVVDADLWRNVGTLAFYGVAKGYQDGTYDPTGTVLHAQAVSFATRALVTRGYWQPQADDPALYPNIPSASGHRQDLATYVHYAGAVPGTVANALWDGPGGWDQPASRSYFARVLWQAYSSYFSTNHIP